MAKAQQQRVAAEDGQEVGPVTETITYVPGQGDPASVQWGGIMFHANMPKELTGHPDGTSRERLNHELIELARGNKHFAVGTDPSKHRRRMKAAEPETADQYRAHMAEWLKDPEINSTRALIERFAKERDLRVVCEVGSIDYDLIGSLLMPKLGALAKGDELTEQQVSALWRQNGFNELPWNV